MEQRDVIIIGAGPAGYAWDQNNPFVAEPERRFDVIAQICAAERAREGAVA